jgi:hypothetical protein
MEAHGCKGTGGKGRGAVVQTGEAERNGREIQTFIIFLVSIDVYKRRRFGLV